MYFVYVIRNLVKDKYYIGQTQNLLKRLLRHNHFLSSKKTSYTNRFSGEWKIIYKEMYNTRIEALKREKQLKSYQGRRFIKKALLGR